MILFAKNLWSRREVLKRCGLISASAAVAPLPGFAKNPDDHFDQLLADSGTVSKNLYTQIGVRPLLNARGTYTIISGSESLPEVKKAMFEASNYFVNLDELMPAVGAEIAKLMGAPMAIVTTGCEAAIALATVACICGTDPELAQSMPYIAQHRQVIIPKYSRNPYDFGVRMCGPEIIEVETDEDLRGRITTKTAMIYVMSGPRAFKAPLSIRSICAIAKEKGVPVFVDAAAEEPVVPNIHLAAGATFVGYSGGKCMRGPQAAGVLLGPEDLCAAAFWNAAPHHNWGRALKVGKEEVMGMLAAVRQWYKRDHEAEQRRWLDWDNSIARALQDIPSLTTHVEMPGDDLSNRAPVLTIRWDGAVVGITGAELIEKLDKGTPRIAVGGGEGHRPDAMKSAIEIMPYMMQPGDHLVIAEVIGRYLRHPDPVESPSRSSEATADLSGTWNVSIDYVRGVGHQQFVLRQQDRTVEGEQHGEIFSAALHGRIEGKDVTLRSMMRPSSYYLPYVFTGKCTGNTLSGDVTMGEYGSGRFVATRL
jgi:seryl-tRNA(Sec) selenium transferase